MLNKSREQTSNTCVQRNKIIIMQFKTQNEIQLPYYFNFGVSYVRQKEPNVNISTTPFCLQFTVLSGKSPYFINGCDIWIICQQQCYLPSCHV